MKKSGEIPTAFPKGKMKKIFIILILLLLIGACNKPELPAGYKILCCPEGKYTMQADNGYISANVWNTKRRVINYAIEWAKSTGPNPSSKYTWEECK